MAIDPGDYRTGMRLLASGVTLVTTTMNGIHHGLTASAVCSLSAEKPMLLACVNKAAGAHDVISDAGLFCVNVLAETHVVLARAFSDSKAKAARFEYGEWATGLTGAPVLTDAVASFDCVVDTALQKATHTIYVGAVQQVRAAPNRRPLLYFDAGFSTLAPMLHETP
jgi:flavin reductase